MVPLNNIAPGPATSRFGHQTGNYGAICLAAGLSRFCKIVRSTTIWSPKLVRGGTVQFEPQDAFCDPLISQIGATIAHEIDGGFFDRILADALNTALAVQVTRRFVDQSAIMLEPSNGPSRERLKRVREYIEAYLDNRLTLTDLAGVACLSPYHFSRSFEQAIGLGPQRYVMQRRLERAKSLMRRTNEPLAMIAQPVGFADQSHLTSIFRRETGVAPGRYRSACVNSRPVRRLLTTIDRFSPGGHACSMDAEAMISRAE
jgi:AraC-like DNA-binding protein